MGTYNGRQLQLDGSELDLNELGEAVIQESNIDVHEFSGFPITNNDLQNNSLSVAGQNVALGGSTSVSYTNLSDTGSSFPIENSDLKNSSLTIAGNSLSLGGSANPAVTDFNGFPLSIGTDTDTPDWNQINNVPTLPEGVTASEATAKFSGDHSDLTNVNSSQHHEQGVTGETNNEKIEYGTIQSFLITDVGTSTTSVSFNTAFNSVGAISTDVGVDDSSSSLGRIDKIHTGIQRSSVSATGFTIVGENSDRSFSYAYVNWIAIGE